MVLISHRGNLNGINLEMENKPEYINYALESGFNVEIDVWYHKEKFFLGHDNPTYLTSIDFLKNEYLWCHAKSIETLRKLISFEDIHCFYHESDPVTLTSKNFLWTYPKNQLTNRSICVESNRKSINDIKNKCFGLCSDYVGLIL